MKHDYKKPQVKIKMVVDEPVMLSTSAGIDDSKQNIDRSDIGAKKNVFSDFSDFSSSSSSASSSDSSDE